MGERGKRARWRDRDRETGKTERGKVQRGGERCTQRQRQRHRETEAEGERQVSLRTALAAHLVPRPGTWRRKGR